MQNYNTALQSNNINLQSILDSINELPEADSGEQATPEISVDSSNGLITATAGTKSSTYQLAFQPALTITPSTIDQIVVSSGYFTGGNVTVEAVPTQTKSVTPKSTTQNVTPDSGKFLSKVTVNGDSNLVAENIKSGISIFGVNGTLEEGGESSSGELVDYSENEDAIINRTISNYTNDRLSIIGSNAFYYCTSLTSVSFPACTNIRSYAFACCNNLTSVSFPACTSMDYSAFYSCTSLTSVSFPACTYIGSVAFRSCTRLTSVNFPACTSMGSAAFSSCTRLTYINFPACTYISYYAFNECTSLTSVNFPSCSHIGNYAFNGCTSLTSVNFPSCNHIGNYAFCGCTRLTSISFPACSYIGSNAFYSCNSLTSVNFPACTTIGSYAFAGCSKLASIYLTNSTVCALSNSYAFSNTGIGSNKGCIYVPYSLVASYQIATNWTYFSSVFVGI